ncbi:hypothetical protein FACS189490_07250 [Clostridia bacterium]|nr:hypothetical protein FACS189490_07250 [Clostridia bacterium]
MNRQNYLSELKSLLSAQMGENEVSEIVSDYREYFQNGEADGLSDSEMFKRLGNPAKLARVLIGDKPQRFSALNFPKILRVYAPKAALLVFCAVMGYVLYLNFEVVGFSNGHALPFYVAFELTVPLVLYFLFDVRKYARGEKTMKHGKLIKGALLAASLVTVLLAAFATSDFAITAMLRMSIILPICLCGIITVYAAEKGTKAPLSALWLFCGGISMAFVCLYRFLGQLSEAFWFNVGIVNIGLVAAVAAFSAIVILVVYEFRESRGK